MPKQASVSRGFSFSDGFRTGILRQADAVALHHDLLRLLYAGAFRLKDAPECG
jgi:hypothetical protein